MRLSKKIRKKGDSCASATKDKSTMNRFIFFAQKQRELVPPAKNIYDTDQFEKANDQLKKQFDW